MADNMNGSRTKADLIIDKIAAIDGEIAGVEKRVSGLSSALAESKALTDANAKATAGGIEQLKTEISFVSAQLESVCVMLNRSLSKLAEEVAELKNKSLSNLAEEVAELKNRKQLDVEELASLVAAKIVVPEVKSTVVQQQLDYDALGYAVAKSIYVPQAIAEEIDYEDLASKIAEKLPAPEYVVPTPEPEKTEVDYDLIAAKVSQVINTEPLSVDRIAALVAEQIVVPAAENTVTEIDTDDLANKISDKIVLPAAEAMACPAEQTSQVVEMDAEAVATEVVNRLATTISESLSADDIADCVAKKVGNVSPEDFEITVDDDGCDSLAKAIEGKLDYDALAAKVAEKISSAYAGMSMAESVDADEIATAISEKLTVNAAIDEDALAEKAASILSNYMPEVDNADIADKVIAGIIPAIPAAPTIDSEAIADEVSARVLGNQNDDDYEIVIDDEGVAQITESMKGELTKLTDEHYQKVESDLAAVKEEYSARFDKVDEQVEELKNLLAAGAVVVASADNDETAVAEDELVTVSDVVGEEQTEEVVEDTVIEEMVSDIEETPAEGEMLPDGMDEESAGGIDFANMMKYNRSFIARIIQGTDDQKNYYGQVKTALLSYKKVNSNVAWGAERFNKGRETIARFKIRGKTLCLYLALDPAEFETSVYHHVDVSDNKSMHGTPMMVKIKSARGVKKAIRLIEIMLEKRDGIKRNVAERDYAAMYPYETIEELIEDGLVKDVSKK